MIQHFRMKILIVVLTTCLLLLVFVLSFVFAVTRESSLSDSYSSMIWVLDDIKNGIYYGIPLGAPRPMAILFMNPDGTLDETDSVVRMRSFQKLGSYEEIFDTLLQYDGSPQQYSANGSSYLVRYKALDDGRTVFILVDVTLNMKVLKTFQKNAVTASAVAMVIMLILSLFFVNWVIQPVIRAKDSQQNFFATASHDLLTPLTTIIANAGLLEEFDSVDPSLAEYRENIRTESKHMKQLLRTMLDHLSFEAVAANRNVPVRQELDFGCLVMNKIRSFESLFRLNNRELICDITENLWVYGSGNDLERVIGILLDNALKYSDQASGTLVRLYSLNGGTVQLDVHSKSEPMDPQTLSKIFLPFYRADPSGSKRDSYGLGLSTAKSIMVLHDGSIRATTGKHENVFHLSLPQIDCNSPPS